MLLTHDTRVSQHGLVEELEGSDHTEDGHEDPVDLAFDALVVLGRHLCGETHGLEVGLMESDVVRVIAVLLVLDAGGSLLLFNVRHGGGGICGWQVCRGGGRGVWIKYRIEVRSDDSGEYRYVTAPAKRRTGSDNTRQSEGGPLAVVVLFPALVLYLRGPGRAPRHAYPGRELQHDLPRLARTHCMPALEAGMPPRRGGCQTKAGRATALPGRQCAGGPSRGSAARQLRGGLFPPLSV